MKKALLAIIFITLFCSDVWAVAILEATDYTYPTGINEENKAYVVNSVNAVAAGASAVFKIPADADSGILKRVIFRSESTNCEIWLSSEDGESATSDKTFYYDDDVNLGVMSAVLNVDYYKTDSTMQGDFHFFTIDNTTTNITTWTLICIYER